MVDIPNIKSIFVNSINGIVQILNGIGIGNDGMPNVFILEVDGFQSFYGDKCCFADVKSFVNGVVDEQLFFHCPGIGQCPHPFALIFVLVAVVHIADS